MAREDIAAQRGPVERTSGSIVLYLSPRHPNPPLPYELRDHINEDDWATRVPTISRIAGQYYKPMFERIWLLVSLLALVVGPFAVYRVIYDRLVTDPSNANFGARLAEARVIGFAIFLVIFGIFYVPMFIWKFIGKRRVASKLKGWAKQDRARLGPSAYIPVWAVRTPTVFMSQTVLRISLPPNVQPTIFHPNAYLPQFINLPEDHGGAYYYPYQNGQPGVPRMSTVGTLPPTYAYNPAFEVSDEKAVEKV